MIPTPPSHGRSCGQFRVACACIGKCSLTLAACGSGNSARAILREGKGMLKHEGAHTEAAHENMTESVHRDFLSHFARLTEGPPSELRRQKDAERKGSPFAGILLRRSTPEPLL